MRVDVSFLFPRKERLAVSVLLVALIFPKTAISLRRKERTSIVMPFVERSNISLRGVALKHFAVTVDGKGFPAGGEGDSAVVAAGLLAGFLGSAEGFFKAGAVVGSHAAKDRWPGCQKPAPCRK